MWYLSQLRLSYHRPGSLNNRYLFSHSFGACKSEIRVPAWWSSGKGSLLGFQTACCLLTVLKWHRERALVPLPLPLKALIPPRGGWGVGSHPGDLILACRCVCAQLCATLCDPMDFSVHGISQTRILQLVAISYSRDLPNPGIKPMSLGSPGLAGRVSTTSATWEAHLSLITSLRLLLQTPSH